MPAPADSLRRRLLEYLNEQVADDGAGFTSGLSMPSSAAKKRGPASIRRTSTPWRRDERLHYPVAFAAAEQAVVDEEAGHPVADRAVQERRGYRGVDPARDGEQHPALLPDLGANRGTRSSMMFAAVHTGAQPQIRFTKRRKIAAPWRVWATSGWNWRPYSRPLRVRHARDGRVRARRDGDEPLRQCGHVIAVAHPHVEQTLTGRAPARSSMSRSSSEWPRARTSARPNSRAFADSTAPPKWAAIACIP